ncbi:hypothetical protein Gohar_005734 [Gossypium harknessii]|uniref:Uncharacterized protein n=1 Tax=Gossypium harknessii TaxID=34285 RepID=A0A7J9H8W0_9ROSI|nr:hypothetical protein [Gossypium harknessii]
MGTTDELTSCMAYCWACLSSSSVHIVACWVSLKFMGYYVLNSNSTKGKKMAAEVEDHRN